MDYTHSLYSRLHPRSLQQRTTLYILLPIFILLTLLAIGGYLLLQEVLMDQWGKIAIANLQQTAHQLDMRLRKPKDLLLLVEHLKSPSIQVDFIHTTVDKIKELEAVKEVRIDWLDPQGTPDDSVEGRAMIHRFRPFYLAEISVSFPGYTKSGDHTVSFYAELRNNSTDIVGKIEIRYDFEQLIDTVLKASWWKGNKAYLVDDNGQVLISAAMEQASGGELQTRLGEQGRLEKQTLRVMADKLSGTVIGPGFPPAEISGFYHLSQAPWTLVIISPGVQLLKPIIRFRWMYALVISVFSVVILLTIRRMTQRMTEDIEELSRAADRLARGRFDAPLPVRSRDELGKLTTSFNTMSTLLHQRIKLQQAMSIAREVQQNLLPQSALCEGGLEIIGKTLYCDETGGDLYDIYHFPDDPGRFGVAVGDVVGHGIGAALQMATTRALLRCRLLRGDDLEKTFADINALLCEDMARSGNFVTIFYIEFELQKRRLRWVRCGHEPATLFTLSSRKEVDLKGQGVALGIDTKQQYIANELYFGKEEQLILVGSDGAWEVESDDGSRFGRDRLLETVKTCMTDSPENILNTLFASITSFRGTRSQIDDITLAIIKIPAADN